MMRKHAVGVLACAILVSIMGCNDNTSTTSNLSRGFTIEFKGSSSSRIASGSIQLPARPPKDSECAGQCKISVPNPPAKPATQQEYAIVCLSANTGTFSGRMSDGHFRIELAPQADDNTIFLEGDLDGKRAKRKWYYQSFAGYNEIGTFEAREVP